MGASVRWQPHSITITGAQPPSFVGHALHSGCGWSWVICTSCWMFCSHLPSAQSSKDASADSAAVPCNAGRSAQPFWQALAYPTHAPAPAVPCSTALADPAGQPRVPQTVCPEIWAEAGPPVMRPR